VQNDRTNNRARSSQHSQQRYDPRRQFLYLVTLTVWPQNKCVYRTHGRTLLRQVWWSWLHWFLRYRAKKTDRQTNTQMPRKPTHATTVGVINNNITTQNRDLVAVWRFVARQQRQLQRARYSVLC